MKILAALLPLLALSLPAQAADPDNCIEGLTRSTLGGHFRVKIAEAPSPVPVSRPHAWVVVLTDSAGKPLADARLTVSAAMPQHRHGLLSAPKTRTLAQPGSYRVEGLKFHMPGYWEVSFEIRAGTLEDRLMVPLDL